jgi:hypothetical protein
MRVQTLDNDAPVGSFSVVVELEHEDWRMLWKVYGPLMNTRLRS